MKEKKYKFKSIRLKLFLTLSVVVVIIIAFLILMNNFVLETFYLYSKQKSIIAVYNKINSYYQEDDNYTDIELELEKIAINYNFDILIRNNNNISIYSSNKDFLSNLNRISIMMQNNKKENVLYENDKLMIRRVEDTGNGLTFILCSAMLDNGYILYIRMPIASVKESVKISNTFLYLIGGFTIIIGGIVVSFISRKFTTPILELNDIANKMSKLDFSHKYITNDTEDEINNLGKSINTMSETLEKTIKQLRSTNIELEKDIEEKSKIDEMRKQFIRRCIT